MPGVDLRKKEINFYKHLAEIEKRKAVSYTSASIKLLILFDLASPV